MKHAHITSRPGHQLGDKVLGLCGEEFKVKTLWADIPEDHPICRACVDAAITALTEADDLIERARISAMLVTGRADRLDAMLNPETPTKLDVIVAADQEHREAREQKQLEKAERKRAQQTCTCTWTSTDARVEDPDCPIHGSTKDEDEGDA